MLTKSKPKILRISVPGPHPKQKLLDDCEKKRIVVNAGRRGGKTTWASRIAIKKAAGGKRVLYIAPVSIQTDAFWDMCCEWLSDAIVLGLVEKNETKRIIKFASGGRIEARTGNRPDHLRGGYGDYIVLDEYAFQDPQIWRKVCMPMLLDNDGTVVFISTPNMRNHFYHLYLAALEDDRWATFEFSSLENPHLSKEALDDMIKDMLEVDYQQEILAKFVPGEGAVFRFTKSIFVPQLSLDLILAAHGHHRLCAGLDWGQKNDFTVLSLGCADCKEEVALWRTNQMGYPAQREFIKSWIEPFDEIEILAEANSIGMPNIEQLWRDGIEVEPFNMTSTSKPEVVHQMQLVMEREEWKFVENEVAERELESYEMKVSPSGRRQFNAPHGLHDDCNVARMLMLHQAINGRFSLA